MKEGKSGSRRRSWIEAISAFAAVVFAAWRVEVALAPGEATASLPREVQAALQQREQGKLEPHPALVEALSRASGSSVTATRAKLLAGDLGFDGAAGIALGSPDDRVALGACAWVCYRGIDLSIAALSDVGHAARGRALAVIAASCSGDPGATEMAHASLEEPGEALGGAYALWRLGVPVLPEEGRELPEPLRSALALGAPD